MLARVPHCGPERHRSHEAQREQEHPLAPPTAREESGRWEAHLSTAVLRAQGSQVACLPQLVTPVNRNLAFTHLSNG